MPERIVLSRKKGARMPSNTVNVARPSKWGNPYRLDDYRTDYPDADDREVRRMAVSDFRGLIEGRWDRLGDVPSYPRDEIRTELAGKNLACWCPSGEPCHADVLLEVANS